jgi:hypothetical protein
MKRIYLTVWMILHLISVHAELIQVNNMQDMFSYFKDIDSNTLVIFDVDMVLVQPNDPAFQMANMKRHRHIVKEMMKELTPEKQMIFLSLMTIKSQPVLIDPRISILLSILMEKRIPSMALTANLTGEFACIKNMEKWKIESLRSLGIDFSQLTPFKNSLIFSHLPSFRGNYSVYVDGILFVNGNACSKGDALLTFLQQTKITPKKIIFIDDREENLKSVQTALKGSLIDFLPLHFVGAQDYPSKVVTEEHFEARWKELLKESEVLN